MPKTRTEDEEERARSEEDDMPPPSSKPMPGKEPDGKCADCGSQNEENAKFCDQCGASLAARPMEADRSEERQQPPAPDRMSTSSLNAILGVPEGASLPVQKAAALDLRSVYDHAAKLTGEKSAGRVRGALNALAKDASDGARANRDLRELRERSDAKERLQLAHRFVKLGDPRERVYRLDADGKVAGLKSYYANAPLDELRGEVEAREKAQPPTSPFREDRERAETAAKEGGATGSTMTLEAAKRNPRVLALFNEAKGRGSKQTLDDVANEWLKAAAGGA